MENGKLQNSQLLQLMGLPPEQDDISYDVCLDLRNASWDEVSSRITTHPSEAVEEDMLHGNSPLEIMIKSKSKEEIPLEIYRKILTEQQEEIGDSKSCINDGVFMLIVRKSYTDEYMKDLMNLLLDFTKNADGRRLIETCIWYGNVAAAKVVTDRFPSALKKKDKIKGQLPIHIACEESNNPRQSELIEHLLREGANMDVGGEYGAGGLFEKDHRGTTPLMQIIHSMNNPFSWDAELFQTVVEIAYDASNPPVVDISDTSLIMGLGNEINVNALNMDVSNISFGDGDFSNMVEERPFHFPILHEAMRISSPDAFYRIIEIVKDYDAELAGKDVRGRTALIKAIYLDEEETNSGRRQFQRKTTTKEIISMIVGAVTSDCTRVRDGAGRLPIHIACEMESLTYEDFSPIARAFPEGLKERHIVTRLYPFMTASVGHNRDLTTIFELLRENPRVCRKARSRALLVLNSSQDSGYVRGPVHWPAVHSRSWDSWAEDSGDDSGTRKTDSTSNSLEEFD